MSHLVHLHTHTLASDGIWTAEYLLDEARRFGYTRIAITDHNTLAGYDQAIQSEKGIDIIAGCELTMTDEETGVRGHVTVLLPDGPGVSAYGAIQALCQLREDQRLLTLLKSIPCLILSGCKGGILHRTADRTAPWGTPAWGLAFTAHYARWQRLFGDRLYLEMMRDTHYPEIWQNLILLLKTKVVTTFDVHGTDCYPLADEPFCSRMYHDTIWLNGIKETQKIAQRLRHWEGWATPNHHLLHTQKEAMHERTHFA